MSAPILHSTPMELREMATQSESAQKWTRHVKHLSYALCGALLAGLFVAAAPAKGSSGAGSGGMSSGPGQDNDNIGSLPLAGTQMLGLYDPSQFGGSPVEPAPLSLVLRGPQADVHAALVSVAGNGIGQWMLDPDSGELTIRLFGELDVVLDSAKVVSAELDLDIQLGSAFVGGLGTVVWNTNASGPRYGDPFGLTNPLQDGKQLIDVPMDKLAQSGLLDAGQVSLLLWSEMQRGTVSAFGVGESLIQFSLDLP